MRKAKYIAILGALIVSYFCSCSREDGLGTMVFSLKITSVGSYSAVVEVRHNRTNRDLWCGFVVEGHDVDVQSEIIAQSTAFAHAGIMDQKKREMHLFSLTPDNDYTYIVVGIDNDGNYNGCYGNIEFSTLSPSIDASVNPNWTVTYMGQKLYNNGYYSNINVQVLGAIEERYLMLIVTQEDRDRFQNETDFIAYATETYEERYNTNHNRDFWIEQTYTVSMSFYRCLDPGQYVAYAIGVDGTGKPTGHYAKSEYFVEESYPMTPGYANMIGTWRLVDAENVPFTVRFAQDTINKTLIMTGWRGSSYPIKVRFSQSSKKIYFDAQFLAANVEFRYNGEVKHGDLYFKGWYLDDDMTCIASVTDVAVGEPQQESSNSYTISSAFDVFNIYGTVDCPKGILFAYYNDESTYFGSKVLFPICMTKQ